MAFTVRQIREGLGIPKSTIFYWVNDLYPEYFAKHESGKPYDDEEYEIIKSIDILRKQNLIVDQIKEELSKKFGIEAPIKEGTDTPETGLATTNFNKEIVQHNKQMIEILTATQQQLALSVQEQQKSNQLMQQMIYFLIGKPGKDKVGESPVEKSPVVKAPVKVAKKVVQKKVTPRGKGGKFTKKKRWWQF